mmetsp:Transcript_25637/g.48576  ORF Transcript_25637/g.48576 Transcript_25637/m.48576 type:complete len:276 (-) Transcript_25637:467-1294(-)|eukprot:CAMPEP_0114251424 /NCGR_PEP_ID=MMETSP0058-20121206/15263_1 /TAXON_ID=36894 /ORGANISM="Pyramimonas parkeae, CCMP726" /LENGTH=275 /DNA_ID=CAMNT_0001365225 /DNA_START=251 /DNA_END=1078 /DNA_ORIENTATION=+
MASAASRHKSEKAQHGLRAQERRASLARRQAYGKQTVELQKEDPKYVRIKGKIVPVKDIQFLREYFQELDLDSNGVVDFLELQSAMQKGSVDEPRVLNPEDDTNDKKTTKGPHGWGFQNGGTDILNRINSVMDSQKTVISFEDILKLMYHEATKEEIAEMIQKAGPVVVPQPVERAISQEDDADFDALWDSWDFDNSGELDQVELREALRTLNVHDKEDFDMLWESLDEDKNGTVSKAEFKKWWFAENTELPSLLLRGSDAMDSWSESMNSFSEA